MMKSRITPAGADIHDNDGPDSADINEDAGADLAKHNPCL